MAQTIVATDLTWLAERQIVVGARVGSCTIAHHCFGTVIAVRDAQAITVQWDDASSTVESWSAISPLGYTVEVGPLAASPSQWASAACHLERTDDWRAVRSSGVRYIVITSATSGHVYTVRADAAGCSCPWYQRTGKLCAHMLSVYLAALGAELATEAAPIFPPCRVCGALTDGARRLCDDCAADQARRLDRAARRQTVAA